MKKLLLFLAAALFIAAPLCAQQRYTQQQKMRYTDFINAIRRCNIAEVRKGIQDKLPLNINTPDEQRDTLLIIAVRNECKEAAFMLLAAGASPMPNRNTLTSPLNLIMEKPSSSSMGDWNDIVVKMLEANANPNYKNANGEHALIIAARGNKRYYVQSLLDNSSVRLDQADNTGRTALHWAAAGNYGGIIEDLCDANASFSKRDNDGRTPLAIAQAFRNNAAEAAIRECLQYT